MARTWVLVAHRAGARIFEHPAAGDALALVEEIEHPTGRLKSGEIDSDRPGASMESARHGMRSMEREESAHARDASNFAHELARYLEHGRVDNRFDQVVVVAEPHFLGLLRGCLDEPTRSCIAGELPKDLQQIPIHELHSHLADVLRVAPPQRYH